MQHAHLAFPQSVLSREINKAFLSETPEDKVSVTQSPDTLFGASSKQPPQCPEKPAVQYSVI